MSGSFMPGLIIQALAATRNSTYLQQQQFYCWGANMATAVFVTKQQTTTINIIMSITQVVLAIVGDAVLSSLIVLS
jgi:hypothetical protein